MRFICLTPPQSLCVKSGAIGVTGSKMTEYVYNPRTGRRIVKDGPMYQKLWLNGERNFEPAASGTNGVRRTPARRNPVETKSSPPRTTQGTPMTNGWEPRSRTSSLVTKRSARAEVDRALRLVASVDRVALGAGAGAGAGAKGAERWPPPQQTNQFSQQQQQQQQQQPQDQHPWRTGRLGGEGNDRSDQSDRFDWLRFPTRHVFAAGSFTRPPAPITRDRPRPDASHATALAPVVAGWGEDGSPRDRDNDVIMST